MNKWGNRTRIVATIGPASGSVTQLARMAKAGMRVARLNFSHGTHKEHLALIKNVKLAEKKSGCKVAILQDLQGPKIRIGALENAIKVKNGEKVIFNCGKDVQDDEGEIPVGFKKLAKVIKKGEAIFVDDGMLEFKVIRKKGNKVVAEVIHGGEIGSHKGINIPDTKIGGDPFTDKDLEDLNFGIKNGVHWIALSFVDEPNFVKKIKNLIKTLAKKYKSIEPKLLIKIERKSAVEDFIDFLPFIDGIMIARGDLGVEMPFEQIPLIQKDIIEICRMAGKPVIVATHMLESMKVNPRATRAEVSDVANAVIDNADAVMLSAETATGDHPYKTVITMSKVIEETEKSFLDDILPTTLYTEDEAIHIARMIYDLGVSGLIDGVVTAKNFKVFEKLGVYRPEIPFFIACDNEEEARQVLLRSSVEGIAMSSNVGTFVHRAEMKIRKEYFGNKKTRLLFIVEGSNGELNLTLRG